MALTRLDNLYSSKTGRYLYVSPDDFNATDELDNRGNSPLRPFKTIQRAFIEVSRYSYLPNAEDRFDQFSIMLMPGNHYIDNRPGTVDVTNKEPRYLDGANLIEANRQEIIDRAFAQIAIEYNENAWGNNWVVPGDNSLAGNTLNRFFDAYRLIQRNRDQIIDAAYATVVASPPSPAPANLLAKCKRDIGYFIDAVSLDVCLGGGNKYTRKFVQNYFNAAGNSWLSNTLVGEEQQSRTAFAAARDQMNLALTNQLTYKDLTITADPVTNNNQSQNSCDNVKSVVFSLSQIVLDVITAGNLNNLVGQTSSPAIGDGQNICKRDIGYIVDATISDLKTGGNSNIIQAARSYFGRNGQPISNGLIGEEAQSIIAFNAARDMMRKAVTNRLYTKDLTLLSGPSVANGTGAIQPLLPSGNEFACVDVQDTISSLILILTTVIADGNLSSLDLIEITGDIPIFNYNQALEEWNDNSILDLSNPDNVLYKFNASTGGAIVPRGCSLIGYDLRRTIVRPLYVPDPADGTQGRTSVFNLTGGCYIWQFTIKDGDLSTNSPLFDSVANVGKVYYQAGNTLQLAVPEYSHHKICIMEYADSDELDIYYTKISRAFSRFQPTIDDGDFLSLVQENRIVGPLSDTRRIESVKITDSSPVGTLTVQVTTKIDHGYFVDQYVAILNNGLSDQLNGTFKVTNTNVGGNPKVFEYKILGSISSLGNQNLVNGATYTSANGLDTNAVSQAEIDSVESASPYVFNCSIRSTWGMCGMWADGSKATGFKSMVVAQYTGVSLQKDDRAFIRYDRFTNTWNQASLTDAFATVPYHTKGDAYWKDDWRNFHIRASDDSFVQCVSVFAVGFHDHFLMESGGDMSITNSNSNFGNTSLHAIGFKGFSFNQDKGGYITDIIPPKVINSSPSNESKIQYYTLDILASNDQTNNTKVYIGSEDATDPANRPAATIQGYRIGAKKDEKIFVKLDIGACYSTLTPTGFDTFTTSLETLNPSGIQINNRAQDAANRIEDNKNFIQNEAYQYIVSKYPALLTNTNITIAKCQRDIGYFVDAVVSDLRLGGNINTIQAAEGYFVGGSLAYITGELTETIDALGYVKNLSIAAMRNFDYLRRNCSTTANSSIINVGDTSGLVIGMRVAQYTTNSFVNNKLIASPTVITSNIPAGTYIKNIIDATTIQLGTFGSRLNQGTARNALQNSSSAWLYFTLENGAWYPTHSVGVTTDPTITQAPEYPECFDIATIITQYFNDIQLTINQGPNTVIKIEPVIDYTNLIKRSTIFTINTGAGTSNPHNWETGTPVKLVPRAKPGTNPDKRLIRLPKGFEANTRYYVIAPGRKTEPYDYSGTTYFNGSDQTKLMLAATKENAAAGIYIYSPETESVDPDVEIVIEQYVLDDVYDLHKYKCNFINGDTRNIQTDVAHIFDLPNAAVTPQKVFFRVADDILNSELPQISGQGTINSKTYYYARYVNSKQFTIHVTHADAISGTNEISFVNGTGNNFYVFANKRRSPLLFDAEYSAAGNTSGLWYLQVINESSGGTLRTDSILTRFHDVNAYGPGTGKIRTLDSWYTRIQDARSKEDRVYRLRYVIPKYLETVRNPLNGFVVKIRTDDKRRLIPQKIVLAPVAGNTQNTAVFKNPDLGGFQETIGLTQNEYINDLINPIGTSVFQQSPEKRVGLYDPYYSPKIVETESNIAFTIQSARKIANNYLEVIAFDHTIINESLKNETFTVIEISQPQGGDGIFSNAVNAEPINWSGFSSGSAIVHSYKTVNNRYFLTLRITEGSINYSPIVATSFSQIKLPSTITANLIGKANSIGDPQGRDKSNRRDYLYRVEGANVYTLMPGDFITDDTSKRYQIVSVEDVGNIEDSFYIFDINEVQERIAGQQDGIYYLTCVRGNISPFPTNAGVGDNFKNYKFSQPISQLYPQNYKNDPVWFKQLNPVYNDAPISISAADNYIHGLVTVNDSKRSETKELVYDMIEQPALSRYDFVKSEELISVTLNPTGGSNIIEAQEGNAASGSEDRKIPISGNSVFPLEQKLYVELRRPSIARSGNHTFEYLGFGPGNYSTGFPLRQEVVLSDTQDFYAQSKKENGGIVFYTGLNSNGDLYIGNRKINAITGVETYLEQALLEDSVDDGGDNIGSLVTTFDVPVTFNQRITVEGDANFNNPVTISVDANEGTALTVTSIVDVNEGDDISLSNSQHQNNKGNITLGKNRIDSAIYGITPRQVLGIEGQAYSIRTHYLAGLGPSNITPDQSARFNGLQQISYSNTQNPENGDILFKGKEVGLTGSLGWIYANYYTTIDNSNIQNITSDGTALTINWIPTVTNQQLNVVAGAKLRIFNFTTNPNLNGTWTVLSSGSNASCKIVITNVPAAGTIYNIPVASNFEISRANWKEFGVLGSETLRTNTETFGNFKLGINTIARASNTAYLRGFVDAVDETNIAPRANLDLVGTAFISGKTTSITVSSGIQTKVEVNQDNAFLIGGNSLTPNNAAIVRVSTTNNGRVGINTTNAQLNGAADSGIYNVALAVIGSSAISNALRVGGTSTLIGDTTITGDLAVNGGDITTTTTAGTFNLLNQNTFTGTSNISNYASAINIGTSRTGTQTFNIGTSVTGTQTFNIGNSSDNSTIRIGNNIAATGSSTISIGGAFGGNDTNSYVSFDSKLTRVRGDLSLGYSRGIGDITTITVPTGSILDLFSGATTVALATNASTIAFGSQGGTTTIRNSLTVDSSVLAKGNITLQGGLESFNFTGTRAQMGTSALAWTGSFAPPIEKSVDLVTVVNGIAGNATYYINAVDTPGSGDWGGTFYQQLVANYLSDSGQPLGLLTGNRYYLPLKTAPVYNSGDYLLINTTVSGLRNPEIVKIAVGGLVRVNTAPYYVIVERQPLGTFIPIKTNHPDDTAVTKLNIALDATWVTNNLTTSSTAVNLSEFGGSLSPNDYIIVQRTTDGTVGELIKIQSYSTTVSRKLTVNNGASPAITMFSVDSTTGNTIIGDANTANTGNLTIYGDINLAGGCGDGTTTSDRKLTFRNELYETVNINTCTGNAVFGSQYATIFAIGQFYGTAAAAHSTTDPVYVYRRDPFTAQSTGPITTILANNQTGTVTSSTVNIPIATNLAAFSIGDLVAIIDGLTNIEIIQITAAPYTDGNGNRLLPTPSNTNYPAGGRGREGTTAKAWNTGVVVVKIDKDPRTTTLAVAIPATGRVAVELPNTNSNKIRMRLVNGDLVAEKLDTEYIVRINNELFFPDSKAVATNGTGIGALDPEYNVRMPKSYRDPNTQITTKYFGGGDITTHGSLNITSGNIRLYGSDARTLVFNVTNDDGHPGDGAIKDPVTGRNGMYLKGFANIYGNLQVYNEQCQENGACDEKLTFKVERASGSVTAGESLTLTGQVFAQQSASTKILDIQNLGSAGAGTVGPKSFTMYQDGSIDAFGITQYFTANGGRRWTYIAQNSNGLGQTQANPLRPNNNYLLNLTSGGNMVVYLPTDAVTGDIIRFIELTGNLDYRTNLVIRALPVTPGTATAIQGDILGTKLTAGSGSSLLNTAWPGGEMVVQTRNASFGLLYVGNTDSPNDPNAADIPSNLRGWWLVEL
jgi:hypothetical protein